MEALSREERPYNKMNYARSINSAVALLVSIILIIIVAVGLIIPPDKPKTNEAGVILPQMCGQGEPCAARITSGIFVWIIMLMLPGLFMAVFFVQEAEIERIDEFISETTGNSVEVNSRGERRHQRSVMERPYDDTNPARVRPTPQQSQTQQIPQYQQLPQQTIQPVRPPALSLTQPMVAAPAPEVHSPMASNQRQQQRQFEDSEEREKEDLERALAASLQQQQGIEMASMGGPPRNN